MHNLSPKMSYPHLHTAYYYDYSIYKYLIILIVLVNVHSGSAQQQDINIANEYWAKGEKQKAYEEFKSLAKSTENLPLIHNNYLNILITLDRKSTRLNSSHIQKSRMPSSA